MRLLLDTNALLWVMEDNEALTQEVREAITSEVNPVFISIISSGK